MKKLKRFLLILFILIAALAVYVEIINRNSKNMTYRQKVLKAVYPALMWITKLTGKNTRKMENGLTKMPLISFYDLKGKLNNGSEISLATFKGKKVLLVTLPAIVGTPINMKTFKNYLNSTRRSWLYLDFRPMILKSRRKEQMQLLQNFVKQILVLLFR